MLERADDQTLVVLMSDHGAGPSERYMYVNLWLHSRGYMRLKRRPLTTLKKTLYRLGFTPIQAYRLLLALRQGRQVGRTVRQSKDDVRSAIRRVFLSFDDVDWSATRAYSWGNQGAIYINLKGREPQGVVEPGPEYEELLETLTSELRGLRDPQTGDPIVDQVYRREDIYEGDHVHSAPDLCFEPWDKRDVAFGLLQFPSWSWLGASWDRTGGHRMDGLVMLSGPGVRAGHELRGASITDLAPTILAAMGVPIPSDMDGKVLLEAFTDQGRQRLRISYAQPSGPGEQQGGELSREEQERVRERLRGLGYVA
jgi:predicted AlkP superfamily phosphohydrolase/phosphomutase